MTPTTSLATADLDAVTMTNEILLVVAAVMSAVAALAALAVAYLGLRQAQAADEAARRHAAREMDDRLQSRLDPMYPALRQVLGGLEDGVPHEIRNALIPFFVLFSDAYGAHRDGLVDHRDWEGLSREFAYWSQKPVARLAWASFRTQAWTDGFVEYVDETLAGAPAYPDVQERGPAPTVDEWLESIKLAADDIVDIVEQAQADVARSEDHEGPGTR